MQSSLPKSLSPSHHSLNTDRKRSRKKTVRERNKKKSNELNKDLTAD